MPVESEAPFHAYYSLEKLLLTQGVLLAAIAVAFWPDLHMHVTYTAALRAPFIRIPAGSVLVVIFLGLIPPVISAFRKMPTLTIEEGQVVLSDLPKTRFSLLDVETVTRNSYGFFSVLNRKSPRKVTLPAVLYANADELYEKIRQNLVAR